MKRRVLFESLAIAAVVVSLLSSVVFAGYPSPDSDTDYDYGSYSSYAKAYVIAYYGDPYTYTCEMYISSRYAGSAEYDGDMYYVWFIDEVYIQGYDDGSSHSGSSGIDCTLVAAYTVADFKKGAEEWTCEALAYREIS